MPRNIMSHFTLFFPFVKEFFLYIKPPSSYNLGGAVNNVFPDSPVFPVCRYHPGTSDDNAQPDYQFGHFSAPCSQYTHFSIQSAVLMLLKTTCFALAILTALFCRSEHDCFSSQHWYGSQKKTGFPERVLVFILRADTSKFRFFSRTLSVFRLLEARISVSQRNMNEMPLIVLTCYASPLASIGGKSFGAGRIYQLFQHGYLRAFSSSSKGNRVLSRRGCLSGLRFFPLVQKLHPLRVDFEGGARFPFLIIPFFGLDASLHKNL